MQKLPLPIHTYYIFAWLLSFCDIYKCGVYRFVVYTSVASTPLWYTQAWPLLLCVITKVGLYHCLVCTFMLKGLIHVEDWPTFRGLCPVMLLPLTLQTCICSVSCGSYLPDHSTWNSLAKLRMPHRSITLR